MSVNKIYKSRFLAYSLIFSFFFLIATEATPNSLSSYYDEEFKPVVRVQEEKDTTPDTQKDRFEKLFEEGKRLYQEKMDYEGAVRKFNEALDLATTRAQKADVFYHMSLAHYGDLSNKGTKELYETIRRLIVLDYYRELDELLCPPKYIELFEGIKKEYGALRVLSKPAGADVYLKDSEIPAGRTPLIIGVKAGSIAIKIKKRKRAKSDILNVVAGKETTSPVYVLKHASTLLYVIGGIALTAGAGAVLLLKGGAGEKQATGTIQVNSTPQGASIYLDGTATGQTTNSALTDVSPGSHSLALVKEGYEDYEENVSVAAGQTTTVDAILTAIIITVTNPTSSTIWTKGSEVEITWVSNSSLGFQGNLRKSNGLTPLSNSGRNLLPSFRRRAVRSIHHLRNLRETRRESDNRISTESSRIKEISEFNAPEISLKRPYSSQYAPGKIFSIRKEANIPYPGAKNPRTIKKNDSLGKVNLAVSKGISPKTFQSSKTTRALSLTYVKIDLYKGGTLLQPIESNTENDGSYTWTVNTSLVDGSDYKVRVSSVSESGIYDESDNFTIETKSIAITEPTSTTIWTKGDSANISWTSAGTISNVKIELYKGGTALEEISPSTTNTGSFTWSQVNPLLTDGSDYRVRISWTTDPAVYDESDNFTIETKSITVTQPTSGAIWTKGLEADIHWESSGTMSNVKIELYKGSTPLQEIRSSTANNGSYTWSQVSSTLTDGSDYKVRVSWTADPGVYGESDNFTIETKSITVTEPDSDTVWTKNTEATISWTFTGTINDVKIELYKGGGNPSAIIAESTANTGSYAWTVESSLTSSKNYSVKIICISAPEIYGESQNFEIK